MNKIFLISLPRSGSTLMQRVLLRHEDVHSVSEPWILLPLVYATRKYGQYSMYGSTVAADAIDELIDKLPEKKNSYNQHLNEFVDKIYSDVVGEDNGYFLDKTPRYHLIVNELMEIFPKEKFIILWRNPLSVASSAIKSWGKKNLWNLHIVEVDLFDGVISLVDFVKNNKDKVITVNYEGLIDRNIISWKEVFNYLCLDFDDAFLNNIDQTIIKGAMGDKTGIKKYKELSNEPLNKWKKTFNNPIRKSWAKKYLRYIGKERLSYMGYDFDVLMKEIDDIPFALNNVLTDIVSFIYGKVYKWFDLRVIKAKWRMKRDGLRVYGNS